MSPWKTYADPPWVDPELTRSQRRAQGRARRDDVGFADALASGATPEAGREVLTDDDKRVERVMLALRMREGLAASEVSDEGWLDRTVDAGLIDGASLGDGRIVLTGRGRLLADRLVRDLME